MMKTVLSCLFAVLSAASPLVVQAKPGHGGGKSAAEARLAANKAKISLADARGRIDKAISNPKVMSQIMKHLTAADQKQFVADVNAAIAAMPASPEEKTAAFLNANTAALRSAEKGNLSTLVAEVFATVPAESLPTLSEQFAKNLFGRDDPSMSDAQFAEIATKTMTVVIERCEQTDNGSPREALAQMMFVRAGNFQTEEATGAFVEKMIDMLPHEDARELAKDEWFPNALGMDGREQSYESVLASADAGLRPDLDAVLVIAGPQYLDSILHDIGGKDTDAMAYIRTRSPVLDAVENPLPRAENWTGNRPGAEGGESHPAGGDKPAGGEDRPAQSDDVIVNPDEPKPYQWQW